MDRWSCTGGVDALRFLRPPKEGARHPLGSRLPEFRTETWSTRGTRTGNAGDREDCDVVILAEGFGCSCNRGRGLRADGAGAFEAVELTRWVGSFYNAV